jgi:hypothetical protein
MFSADNESVGFSSVNTNEMQKVNGGSGCTDLPNFNPMMPSHDEIVGNDDSSSSDSGGK